ncbi:MAG: hypothetical protein EOP05_07705, partial [Proteobacteria bacterium]
MAADPRAHAEEIRGLRLTMADIATYGDSLDLREFGPIQLELAKIAIFPEGAAAEIASVVVTSQTPEAQKLVDSAVNHLFASKTFRKSFCPYLPSVQQASEILGVSASAGAAIIDHCRQAREDAGSDPLTQRLAKKFSKQVVFLQTKTPAPVESYTSRKGDIHIFHNGSLTQLELSRMLLHELYVS